MTKRRRLASHLVSLDTNTRGIYFCNLTRCQYFVFLVFKSWSNLWGCCAVATNPTSEKQPKCRNIHFFRSDSSLYGEQ